MTRPGKCLEVMISLYVGQTTLIQQESYVPSYEGSLVYLSVDDVTAALDRVRSAGGKVITEKMSIGEYGFVGHFEDTEGNRVGLHSNA